MPKQKPPVRTPEERNALIEPMLKPGNNWVESFVRRKYARYHNDETLEELISIGYEALVYAADRWEERYDRDGRSKFFIYAQNKVRSKIRSFLINKDLPVYVPDRTERKEDFQRPSIINEIDVPEIWDAYEDVETPEEELIQKEALEDVAASMQEHLSSEERFVMGRMNGFIGESTPTYEDLGKELGISKQAAHGKYQPALKKLRAELGDRE